MRGSFFLFFALSKGTRSRMHRKSECNSFSSSSFRLSYAAVLILRTVIVSVGPEENI